MKEFKATLTIEGRNPVHIAYPTTRESDIEKIISMIEITPTSVEFNISSGHMAILLKQYRIDVYRVRQNPILIDGKEYTELGIKGTVDAPNEALIAKKIEEFYRNNPFG